MEFDVFVLLGAMIPILVLLGVTILVMTLVHLVLSTTGNQYRVEISGTLGLSIFVIGEFVMGFFQLSLTLVILILVTPFIVLEAFRPSGGNRVGLPILLDIEKHLGPAAQDVLCFSQDRAYVGLAATRIIGIPIHSKESQRKNKDDSELKQLLPLWENGKRSGTVYTIEVKIADGLVEFHIFVTVREKDWKRAIEETWQSRHVVESWLKQMDYSYETLDTTQLLAVYHDFQYGANAAITSYNVASSGNQHFGILSIDGIAKDLSCNIEQVLNQLTEGRLSGRVLLSLTSIATPHFSRELTRFRDTTDGQSRTPFRVEEYQLRDTYRQMAEVEACEETGAFRIGVSVIIEGTTACEVEKNLKTVEAIIRGVWGGVKVIVSSAFRSIRGWNRFLLRNSIGGSTSVSGARLLGFLDISTPLPGISGRLLSPEFILPPFESCSDDMLPLGYHLRHKQKTNQMYSIHKNAFTTHTLIVGNPGSGKTNTALHLVNELYRRGVPFLVINPAKTEWRQLGNCIPDLRIFTAADEFTAPFRFNFFDVPPGVSIHTHIDNITTCFIAAWPTEGILVEHITKVFRRVYALAGWNVLKNERGRPILLSDLYEAMEQVVSELDYGSRLNQDFVGALKARFESLLEDPILSVMFNIEEGLTIPELLNHRTVLELRGFTETKAALITSLILVGVSEYINAQDAESSQELKHLIVLEEAHHVLKRVDSGGSLEETHAAQQQAINTIVHLLREARGLGLGLILIDQLPGKLADAAVKLPGITIIHYLKEPQERRIVGGQANLSDEQLWYIGALDCGEAIVHQGFHQHAANIVVSHYNPRASHNDGTWNNNRLAKLMKPFYDERRHLQAQCVPVVNSWKPDPVILWNLKYVIESREFIDSFREHAERGVEFSKLYLHRLVERAADGIDPLDIERYVSILLEYVESYFLREGPFNERT